MRRDGYFKHRWENPAPMVPKSEEEEALLYMRAAVENPHGTFQERLDRKTSAWNALKQASYVRRREQDREEKQENLRKRRKEKAHENDTSLQTRKRDSEAQEGNVRDISGIKKQHHEVSRVKEELRRFGKEEGDAELIGSDVNFREEGVAAQTSKAQNLRTKQLEDLASAHKSTAVTTAERGKDGGHKRERAVGKEERRNKRRALRLEVEEAGHKLLAAAKAGYAGQVSALLRAPGGLRPTWRDESGYSALHWAALYGHLEVVRVLLAAGAGDGKRIERRTQAGNTALLYACLGRHAHVASLLATVYKADPYAENDCGQSPVSLGLRAMLDGLARDRHLADAQAARERADQAAGLGEAWEMAQERARNERQEGAEEEGEDGEEDVWSRLGMRATETPGLKGPLGHAWNSYQQAWEAFAALYGIGSTRRGDTRGAMHSDSLRAAGAGPMEEQVHMQSSAGGGGGGRGGRGEEGAGEGPGEGKGGEGEEGGWIQYSSVPWPYLQKTGGIFATWRFFPPGEARYPPRQGGEDHKELLLGALQLAPAELRRLLRQERLRWHPDKFHQAFGRQLAHDERSTVLAEVQTISQMLNRMATSSQ